MARDLFGDVTHPSIAVGARKWYSVPLSFIAHTAIIGALVVTPLVATGALPVIDSGPVVIHLAPPPIPQPPPVRRVAPPAPRVNPDAAPLTPPDVITPETDLPPVEPEADFGFTDLGVIGRSEVIEPPPPPPPVRVEPVETVNVGGAIQPPQRVAYVAPVYPQLALSARIKGMVIIRATIDTEGKVRDAEVLRSDSPMLIDAALTAVRQWTYTPTLLNGIPVNVVMTVTVNFQMQ